MRRLLAIVFVCCGLAVTLPGCSSVNSTSEAPVASVSYESAEVSFLGPEGTYTQEACEVFFDGDGTYLPCDTVSDAVQMLTEGMCDYAVIPQENTIGGAVIDYVDVLMGTPEVSVAGEVVLTINQNLLVLPGTSLDRIRTVYSHHQGITQAQEWLAQNLPDAELIEVSSTAEGARMVAEGNDPSCAAIASAGCADVYDLEVLASAIQNNDNNRTRFYVLTTEEPSVIDADRTAFIASGSAEYLPDILAGISGCGAELITIHDRPLKTQLGEYNYIIECAGLSYEDYLELASETSMEMRFLGCYEVR